MANIHDQLSVAFEKGGISVDDDVTTLVDVDSLVLNEVMIILDGATLASIDFAVTTPKDLMGAVGRAHR